MHCIILKCFTMKGTVLLNFLMKKTKNCTITELSQYEEIPLNYKNGYYIYEL